MTKAKRFLLSLFGLRKKKTLGPFTETYEQTKFDHAFSVSWSQAGEDIALSLLITKDKLKGFYLDIGAHNPSRFSVTRHLYQLGWNGINVDANPELGPAFLKQRKRDTFLNAAVGKLNSYEFHIFDELALSTVNEDWRKKFISEGNALKRVVQVEGITLRSLLERTPNSQKVDLLNMDIEGADYDALESIGFDTLPDSLFPNWLLLETSPPVDQALKTNSVELALKFGYKPWVVLPMATLLKSPYF
jgi:FkbM family methyltransferase